MPTGNRAGHLINGRFDVIQLIDGLDDIVDQISVDVVFGGFSGTRRVCEGDISAVVTWSSADSDNGIPRSGRRGRITCRDVSKVWSTIWPGPRAVSRAN